MISAKNISFHYRGGRNVLNQVGFDLEDGRFLAILGNNGAGKSTLLKCLNRILRADSGSFRMDGEENADDGARCRHARPAALYGLRRDGERP